MTLSSLVCVQKTTRVIVQPATLLSNHGRVRARREMAPLLEAVQNVTIFGFNTDIRSGDTVYHVQTEAHETECSMQTAVFVRGRCIGKYSSSYVTEAGEPDFSQHVHELLKQQHRFVLNSIREGCIETLLNSAAAGRLQRSPADGIPATPADREESVASRPAAIDDCLDTFARAGGPDGEKTEESPAPLSIEFISSQMGMGGSELLLRFRIVAGSAPLEGAKVTSRLDLPGSASCYSQSLSDREGEADVRFDMQSQSAGVPLTVLVQTAHGGESAVRRFRLRRS